MPNDENVPNFRNGIPLLKAFGCILYQIENPSGFVYIAVNEKSRRHETLVRKKNEVTTSGIKAIVEFMRSSSVAGYGQYELDRPFGEQIDMNKANEILDVIFKEILPLHGFNVRKEQLSLSRQILNDVNKHNISLAEAEVGTGKTLAYLVPAVIVKRGRLNDYHNMSLYINMPYADTAYMPVVVATSSIALQQAILNDYIPELSKILLEHGIIKTPLTAVLRKGKDNFGCLLNISTSLSFERDRHIKELLNNLSKMDKLIDLGTVEGLNLSIKRKISVPSRCLESCAYIDKCKYLEYCELSKSNRIDIQVCNHNYFLADSIHRATGKQALIPNYQNLILDEAHKYLGAAQSMYSSELARSNAADLAETINNLTFRYEYPRQNAVKSAKKLRDESERLFFGLIETAKPNDGADSDEQESLTITITADSARHIRNIRDIVNRIAIILRGEAFRIKAWEFLNWIKYKHNADISRVDLQKLIPPRIYDFPTCEEQREFMQIQVNRIYQAVIGLKEIKRLADIEIDQKKKRRVINTPERALMQSKSAKIYDSILRMAKMLLTNESTISKTSIEIAKTIWKCEEIRDQASAIASYNELICWLENDKGENETRLCAIPKNLGKQLFDDQWNKGVPTIFTSGTISAAGDFAHIKRAFGLGNVSKYKLTETTKPSPFDYRKNALLYISKNVPFPDHRDKDYIRAVANELEQLIYATHGHAAILFTSYRVMDMVWELLKERGLPFEMFRLDKGGVKEIEKFKQSRNGVVFAAGSLWEGVDIPGDILSLVAIVKLPFAVPDPIGEYEQTLYDNFNDYKKAVVVPEMLIKLKQGFGRLIRTENDTGVVAILDSRVKVGGAYHGKVLDALPECQITSDINCVADFIKAKKSPEYFR